MDIVDRLFELIDERYQEQRDFAEEIGVSASIVSEWRRRKSASFHKRLPQIAEVLGTTVEYLVTGQDSTAPIIHWLNTPRKIVGTDGNTGNLRQQVTENNLSSLSADEIDRILREALGGLTPEELIQVRAFSQGLVAARAKDTSPKT